MTRASSRNVGKLYTEYQVVHKNLRCFYTATATEKDVTTVQFQLRMIVYLILLYLCTTVPKGIPFQIKLGLPNGAESNCLNFVVCSKFVLATNHLHALNHSNNLSTVGKSCNKGVCNSRIHCSTNSSRLPVSIFGELHY